MSTIILDHHDRTSIERRTITVTVSGLPQGEVQLAARLGSADHPGALHGRPGEMVLRRVEGPTVVRVTPASGRSAFPERSVVTVRLRTDATRDSEGDVVVVQNVEVSGRSFRDVVVIEPDGASPGRLSVAAIGVVVDPPLSDLGAAARAAARARLGVDRTETAVNLLVAVDLSASMAPVFADGSVDAVLEAATGLSQVIGWAGSLDACLLADRPLPVGPTPARELASATRNAAAAAGLGCGFRSAPSDLPVAPGSVTYVVTDAVPADVRALRAAHRPGDVRHLIVVGVPPGPSAPPGLPTTAWAAPPEGGPAGEHLLRNPHLLSELVGSLLVGVADTARSGSGERP